MYDVPFTSGGFGPPTAPDPTTKVLTLGVGMVRTTRCVVASVTRTLNPVSGGIVGFVGAVKFTVARALPAIAWPIVGAPGTPKFTVVSVNCSRSTLRTMSMPSVPALSVTRANARLPSAAASLP